MTDQKCFTCDDYIDWPGGFVCRMIGQFVSEMKECPRERVRKNINKLSLVLDPEAQEVLADMLN